MSDKVIDLKSKDVWDRARQIFISSLQSQSDRDRSERYFAMITSVTAENGVFTLAFSNSMSAELMKNEYGEKIKSALMLAGANTVDGSEVKVKFTVDEKSNPAIIVPITPVKEASSPKKKSSETRTIASSIMPLNPEYTFEEFVRGPSNALANATAISIADKPGRKEYNPFFIYGGTGLGKTHLMHAIGNEIKRKNPNISVCFISAEVFLNEFINALQNHAIEKFRKFYRSIDVLLVDDIQFIAAKQHFQEEFFNTFNSLYGADHQIVMTSDIAPKKLINFEARLISRFEGGMVQEIELPSYETRLAILKKKSESLTPKVPDTALEFIAENIKTHVRAMEGALAKVRLLMDTNPTLILSNETLYNHLNDFIEKEKNLKKITIEEIQAEICNRYAITMGQLLSGERTQSLVTPRQLAMYISRKYTNRSLPEIAKMFDKSHATILHGVKSITKRLDVEPELRISMEEIINKFGYSREDTIC